MPVIWCVDVIFHRPGLTSSLSAATASGVTQQQPNRTIGMRRRVFIERPSRLFLRGDGAARIVAEILTERSGGARRSLFRGDPQTFHLPQEARFHQNRGAERQTPGEVVAAA